MATAEPLNEAARAYTLDSVLRRVVTGFWGTRAGPGLPSIGDALIDERQGEAAAAGAASLCDMNDDELRSELSQSLQEARALSQKLRHAREPANGREEDSDSDAGRPLRRLPALVRASAPAKQPHGAPQEPSALIERVQKLEAELHDARALARMQHVRIARLERAARAAVLARAGNDVVSSTDEEEEGPDLLSVLPPPAPESASSSSSSEMECDDPRDSDYAPRAAAPRKRAKRARPVSEFIEPQYSVPDVASIGEAMRAQHERVAAGQQIKRLVVPYLPETKRWMRRMVNDVRALNPGINNLHMSRLVVRIARRHAPSGTWVPSASHVSRM